MVTLESTKVSLPKFAHRFSVIFPNNPELAALSRETIRVILPTIQIDDGGWEYKDHMSLFFMDGVNNEAVKAVLAQKDELDIHVQILDSEGNALETIEYIKCKFESLTHQYPFDYGTGAKRSHSFKVDQVQSSKIEPAISKLLKDLERINFIEEPHQNTFCVVRELHILTTYSKTTFKGE